MFIPIKLKSFFQLYLNSIITYFEIMDYYNPIEHYDNIENGYGQYIDLDNYTIDGEDIILSPKTTPKLQEKINDYIEYNEYLDRLEHTLEYGPPHIRPYIHNPGNNIMPIEYGNNLTMITNPLVYAVSYIFELFKR